MSFQCSPEDGEHPPPARLLTSDEPISISSFFSQDQAAAILLLRRSSVHGMLLIDAQELHERLHDECRRLIDMLVTSVLEQNRRQNRSICDRFDAIANRLVEKPETTQDMTELNNFLQGVKTTTIHGLRVSGVVH